jgi:tetratricopeptide (TPR) repeat protein
LLYALALVLFLLAILAKPAMAVLPLVVLNLIWWERGRISLADLKPLTPFLLIALLSFVGAIVVFPRSTIISEQHLTALTRAAIIGPAVWSYLYELIRPGTFSFVYPRWHAVSPWAWAMLGAIVVVNFWLWHSAEHLGRGPLVAAKTFLVLLLPQIVFLDLVQTRDSYITDTAMYLAAAAIIVPAVAGMSERLVPRGRELSPASAAPWLAAAVIALVTGTSFYVARSYATAEALWRDAIARDPDSVFALNQLALVELDRSHNNDALAHLRQAWQIDRYNLDTHRNLGKYYEATSQPDRAYAEYLAVIQAQPADVDARCGLARALATEGNREGALIEYQIVLQYRPEYERALNDMAMIYIDLGQLNRAIDCYARAIRAAPGYIVSHINLANLYFRMGNYDGAVRELADAKAIDPNNYVVYVNAGAMCGQLSALTTDPKQKNALVQQSEIEFRQALYYNPESAVAAFNLGKVLEYESTQSTADAGKMNEAVFYFAKASQLDPENQEYQRRLLIARKKAGA